MKNTIFQLGLAKVTTKGLLFNGLYYTNTSLFKEQCFLHAETQGSWDIPIIYDRNDTQHIVLDIQKPEFASAVDNSIPMDPNIVADYQEAIRNLKMLLMMKRNH